MMNGSRRSALYVPGDVARMIEKSLVVPADMLVLNLEDGVARSKKDEARANVTRALRTFDFGRRETVVRINSPASEAGGRDLSAVVPCRPDGICLPKVEDAAEIRAVDAAIAGLEAECGLPQGGIKLHAMIESASGVIHAAEIARASVRMSALIFGSADYAKDLRCQVGEDRAELQFALQMIVTCARTAALDAIDAPCFDFRNPELLRREAVQARRLGYEGKSAIHPDQLEIIHAIFNVTPEEIAWAEAVLAELNEAEIRGKGLSTLDGRLVEDPHRVAAERILRRR
jgi:citrate lyase subunit beta / citryl-CoA lyase